MSTLLLDQAWVDGAVRSQVMVEIEGGRFTGVVPDAAPSGTGDRIAGLVLPGLANCHSHVFHRALRGRTQRERGTFWSWRDQMYAVAARITPDQLLALATATYREMAATGITTVGEFHYLHHRPDGGRYDDPNETGRVLIEAAQRAGVRLTLLDTCYLSAGFGEPVSGAQIRYSDGDAAAWAERIGGIAEADSDAVRIGAAIHSVRAVPADQLAEVVAASTGRPLHVHLSEQRAENEACRAAHGRTPTELLHDHGALGPLTSAVHATHLTDRDIALLGASRTTACFCPTTERDLGDGIGPSRRLHDAGSALSLGSDSHAVIDLFEEMRAVELDERLAAEQRGHWTASELLATGTRHDSLGWDDAGRIAVGARADLVVLDTSSPRTAGTGRDEHTAVFAATGADVRAVMVAGRWLDLDPQAIGRELDEAIGALT